jgi:glycosyltransferase involved in cell wall biosynthesis
MIFTLCVCTHNRGAPIIDTLVILAAQARDSIAEIIVIDNNSTDETAAVVDRFIYEHASVPMRRVFEPRQGLTHARSRAVRETRSEYIAFVDDDVLLSHCWTEIVLRRFDSSPRIGAVGGIIEPKWESGPTALANRRQDLLARQYMGDGPLNMTTSHSGLAGAALALRTAAVHASGWPANAVMTDRVGDETGSAGDYEIVARIRMAGYEIWYEPDARCLHRINPERQTREYLFRLAEGIARSSAWYDWICEGQPTGVEGIAWVESRMADIHFRLRRTQLLEPRPMRRALRIRERRATLAGYDAILKRLRPSTPMRSIEPD